MTETLSVLIIDDDLGIGNVITQLLHRAGHQTKAVGTGEQGLEEYRRHHFDIVLLDLSLPGKPGLEVLDEFTTIDRSLTIVVSGNDQLTIAVDCMRRGAFDFVPKQDLLAGLLPAVDRAAEKLRQERLFEASRRATSIEIREIKGTSPAMLKVFEFIARSAQRPDATILITGESGTGRGLVAKVIHRESSRSSEPYVALSFSALEEDQIESELFGSKKDDVAGDESDKQGLLAITRGGTMLLDEIGDLPLTLQAKLSHFLKDRTFCRVGSTQGWQSDVRILASANMDMRKLVQKGLFHSDLFYRLSVLSIDLPPLRDRQEDIPILTRHFIEELCRQFRMPLKQVTPEAMRALCRYPWPGNVRELRNVVERLLFMVDAQEILTKHLPDEINPCPENSTPPTPLPKLPYSQAKKMVIESFDVDYICQMMTRCDGVVTHAAKMAGMDRANWKRLMRKYGITSQNYNEELE